MKHEDLLSHAGSQLRASCSGSSGAPMVVAQNAQSVGFTHQAVVDWPLIAVHMRYSTFLEHGVEIMAWVYERFGKDDRQWHYSVMHERATFHFRDVNQAVLFKLTWGC